MKSLAEKNDFNTIFSKTFQLCCPGSWPIRGNVAKTEESRMLFAQKKDDKVERINADNANMLNMLKRYQHQNQPNLEI